MNNAVKVRPKNAPAANSSGAARETMHQERQCAPAVRGSDACFAAMSRSRGGDRRRSHREPVVTTATIKSAERGDTSPARQVLVTDVSLHGVGLRSSTELRMGGRYFIEIGVGPLYLSSQMRVVRSVQRSDGTFEIGGQFGLH
jgi:hypothetical protein